VTWRADEHAARRYLDLAVPLGGGESEADARPVLTPDRSAARRVERLLERHGVGAESRLLVVAPGSVWPTKRWIPEGFGRVVAAGASRGLTPVLIGSDNERALCREVAPQAAAPILAGELAIPELVALLARARFGSTASDAGYLACGTHTGVVELAELDCRPCGRHGRRRCPERHFRCMREVDAEQVIARLDEILAASAPGQPTRDTLPG
jgi:heptosyltransferase-2